MIPARLESSRLPRKLLLSETGMTLLEHTYLSACQSKLGDEVVIATDSQLIRDTVTGFGGKALMTSPDHLSGTDRIAECLNELDADLIVNVQGDEPELGGGPIDAVIRSLHDHADAAVSTLATPIQREADLRDPNCVKVVFDQNGKALYFSRSMIPYSREPEFLPQYFLQPKDATEAVYFQHVGIYAFRREVLRKVKDLKPAKIEQLESLEQLRFLDYRWHIQVQTINHGVQGIDTLEDYKMFVKRYQNR
ncbi:MAG: 3-deoxy-manno-octulosonate cytidylyltransferase [Planctomycetota bacterium]